MTIMSRRFSIASAPSKALRWASMLGSIIALHSVILIAPKAEAQVGLEPMVIQTEVRRGQAQSVITVTNPSSQPMRVRVYSQPFTYEREAGFVTLAEDENDLTPYLQFSPREFVIPPNERQRVRVVGLLPPSLAETEYRAVIFTEALPESEQSASSTAGIQTRIGSTVYFRQSAANPELSVVSAQWDAEASKVQLLVTNAGEATARPNVKWTLQQAGESVATGESGATTVIEGGDRLFQLPFDSETSGAIAPGTYELTGELLWRLGSTEQSTESFSTTLTISP
ncbi:MAG: P pilus assembly protein, chaperone PapD [Cyanobacteria bacterium J06560_5]